MPYKEARSISNSGSTEIIVCPLCGWHRPRNFGWSGKTGEKREVRFDKVDLDTAAIIRIERLCGKGRGCKDAIIELLEGRTLAELDEELKAQIRGQCQKILEILGD